MIFSYNKEAVGDVLIAIVDNSGTEEVSCERKGNVAKIATADKTVGYNFFDVSTYIDDLEGNGQVFLTDDQVAKLNEQLMTNGFEGSLVADNTPKFVVGYVKECVPHEDSDHLSVTQIEVDNGEELQIVCGAPNIEQGQKVVVAKPGAMMPNGLIIWPGNLRGVDSFGMVCSAKELNLPDAPQVKGILVLPEESIVGSAFKG
ncbi:YtpR family tRNA-binding protein [Vagococcus xieshaowenii]|uniref:DUF4479 domain-containing protein n=1 Tax=Vagococcus xieshaowenii TaxID=2562451 RepID=A0AAJ5EFQ4_9ENTE|nr:DUF4479 and tRNA-binding domain-containing protein [Vagococcus xieshaowenii]QCA29026.1 DUF4479 domain-containing protein [Vagococcus xieshaowenii]TFZ40998.1 DUF4479 domain-containing protein [Vagococcus xieshaowenii]